MRMFGLGGVLSMRRSTSSLFVSSGVFMAMIQIWSLPPDEYLTLIGRFIVSMSYVEIYLKQLLWKSAHLGHEMGTLFSAGARLDDIQKLLRTIYNKHCPNKLQVDDIELISAETTSLKVARDTMAHQQWNVEGRERTVILRRALARTAEQVEDTPYTIPQLEEFCIRVRVLEGRILRHLVAREAVPAIEGTWTGAYALPPAPWLDGSLPRTGVAGAP
jgi:hypothetical protein